MFFNSISFIGFLLLILVILYIEGRYSRSVVIRNATLLVASYFFYGYFNIGFTFILTLITLINYFAGQLLFSKKIIKKRKAICGTAILLSLIPLLFYKYALFIVKSIAAILYIDIEIEQIYGLLLPVGISFFTFQALSYTIDVYRGKISERPSLLDFALFVSFFPTILSGPIEKARNLLPQIRDYFTPSLADISQGACIFIWGLFKKMVIADRLAYYVDWSYESSQYLSGTTLALTAVFYSIQIYCDFSGYSDMALGVAKSLGFNITKNFRQPYFARTFKDFWHKWHIALTSWFTEYVYFSLGGSRVASKCRWVFNISTIFILSGIWHGAAWNFVVWGGLHAAYYLVEHFLGLQNKHIKWSQITSFLSGTVVFCLVTLAWIFFRVETFDDATYVVNKIFTDFGGNLSMGASSFTFASTAAVLTIFFVYEILVHKHILCFDVENYEEKITNNIISLIPMLILLSMFSLSSDTFVYFQF